MLFIINCKALWGYPWLSEVVPRLHDTEHIVAVCGDLRSLDSGEINSAQTVFRAKDYEICADDDTYSNCHMMRLLMSRHEKTPDETMVVSDIPRDRAAADLLGCECVPPGVFDVICARFLPGYRPRMS